MVLLWGWGLGEAVQAAPATRPNSDCFDCHKDKDLYKTNAAGQAVSMYVDLAVFTNSVHGTNLCMDCHRDISEEHPDDNKPAQRVDCALCHAAQTASYQGSAHAEALKQGKEGSATCVDCHGKHDIIPHGRPESPLHYSRLATTCGQCHPEIAEEVAQSVHGTSLAAGERDAATCTDCHSEHKIEDLRKASPIKISEQICSRCHASERLATKYRIPRNRVDTFMDSYHGLASKYGSTRAANCASCHGVHLILRSSDPRSLIHTNSLVKTCGKCHPGATESFVTVRIHADGSRGSELGSQVNYWVRRVYILLIVVTIGAMLVHNFLSWRRKALASLHAPRTVVRMDLNQRLQHLALALSFLVLALSGFALKFPDSWLGWLMGGDETIRRITHRVAAVVMLVVGAYHLAYAALTGPGRRLIRDLVPSIQDLKDLGVNCLYLLCHGKPRAKFGRFGYPEKAEYWAVVWGTIIMGATGFIIWFPVEFTRWLPGWAVDVATTIHYYEAVLACLAIVVWHFYHVIYDPDVYPMNWACWDGKVSEEWYRHEHPLDTEALRQAAQSSRQRPGEKPAEK